jgi:tetratricopeptide (TPR) repeat protein
MCVGFLAMALATGLCSTLAIAQTPNHAVPDGLTVPEPAAPVRPNLSPEARGDVYMVRKMYREAIEAFRGGPPKDAVLQNKIGIAFHQLMQFDMARKYYQQALRLKPDYMEAQNNLGTVYYAKKNFRRAITCYQKAVKMVPEDARAASIYSNLGTAYFARKQYELASEAYQTALKLNPNVFESHGSFGSMLQERNIEDRGKFHYYMAKLYAKGGRNDLALQYLRKALEEGFKDKKKIEEDPEFESLRDLPEFKDLLALEPRVL